MTSYPDERDEGRTLAAALFGSPEDTAEPDENREPTEDDDPDSARAYARQLFSHRTN